MGQRSSLHVMYLYSGHHLGDGHWEPREALTFDTNLASMHTYLGGLGGMFAFVITFSVTWDFGEFREYELTDALF